MLLQALADHLGGLARLAILVILDLVVLETQLLLIALAQRGFLVFVLVLLAGQLALQLRDARRAVGKLLFLFLHGLRHRELPRRIRAGEPGFQRLDLAVFFIQRALLFRLERVLLPLALHALNGAVVLARALHFLLTAGKLLFKFPVSDLADDLVIAALVHLKHLAAMRTFDLLHSERSFIMALYRYFSGLREGNQDTAIVNQYNRKG